MELILVLLFSVFLIIICSLNSLVLALIQVTVLEFRAEVSHWRQLLSGQTDGGREEAKNWPAAQKQSDWFTFKCCFINNINMIQALCDALTYTPWSLSCIQNHVFFYCSTHIHTWISSAEKWISYQLVASSEFESFHSNKSFNIRTTYCCHSSILTLTHLIQPAPISYIASGAAAAKNSS